MRFLVAFRDRLKTFLFVRFIFGRIFDTLLFTGFAGSLFSLEVLSGLAFISIERLSLLIRYKCLYYTSLILYSELS